MVKYYNNVIGSTLVQRLAGNNPDVDPMCYDV